MDRPRDTNGRMDSRLLASARPGDDVPPDLAGRVLLRWNEDRAAAASYRRWTAGLAAAAVILLFASAAAPSQAPLDDPFEMNASDVEGE